MGDLPPLGASVSPTGLGSAEAPEPHPGLRPSDAIPSAGPRNVRLDDEGEALAHAIFYALNSVPGKKWKDVSRHSKARFREAARAVRRVLVARARAGQ
jgi:hypothetical protein